MAAAVGAQDKIKPLPPAVIAAPTWSRVVPMPDGRTFVTDGGLAIDVAIARPAKMPTTRLTVDNGKILERHFNATQTDEVALSALRTSGHKNTFLGPRDIPVNGNYVAFLRRVAPQSRLRFRGPLDPIVIVMAGRPIGLAMPVAVAR
jgi:hypothetical protein